MDITHVRLTFPSKASGDIKAYARVEFDKQLTVSGIKLIETENGNRFIKFPDRKLPVEDTDGEFVTIVIANTVDDDFRNYLVNELFNVYDKHPRVTGKRQHQRESAQE